MVNLESVLTPGFLSASLAQPSNEDTSPSVIPADQADNAASSPPDVCN